MGLSPEMMVPCGSRRRNQSGRLHACAIWPGAGVPPGSKTGACSRKGRPGTWEALSSPPYEAGEGEETKPLRMGDRESEHLRSTDEVGEPTPRDPTEGRRVSEHGIAGGKDGWELRVPATSPRDFSG